MAEMNFKGRKLKPESHSQEKDNYDRLLAVFHTATEAKRCLLDFYLSDKTLDLLDWLTSISKHFLQFEDVRRARRRSSIITPKDLELNTIDTVLKYNCFDMFWDCCLLNTCLEDILNKHKTELHRIYLNSSKQHDSPFLQYGFTKEQWENLFEGRECLESVQGETRGNITARKEVTVSSLDSNLNVLILNIVCPLFQAVNSISESQMRISKTAVLNEIFCQNTDFDYIWNKIESHILIIGKHCQLYQYFRNCCARIKGTKFNRTLAQDNRKCILVEAFNSPAFVDDRTFCDQVQTELDYISFEENVNIAKELCEKDICVYLHEGQYKRGEYTQSVLQNAEKDLQLRSSVCSTQIHNRHQEEQDKKNETEDIQERCNRHNYLKLVQLINDIGKDVLVNVLKRRLPAVDFGEAFNEMKKRILPLLNNYERQLLYPDNSKYSGDLTDFDISILYIILRHVNTICPHKNGWGNNPEIDDESISANIDRIRMFKNKYVSHCTKCSLNATEFLTTWKQISECIIQIGGTVYTQRIDCLLASEINPVIENELCTAIETLKALERERDKDNKRLEDKIDYIKEELTMFNRQRKYDTKAPESLGYLPLKLRLSGEEIPSVKEIKPDDFTNGDIQINYIEKGSIIIGLDVSPSALKSVGYFLNVIDTLILGLLKKCSTSVINRKKHVPVIIAMEFIGLLSEMQTQFNEQRIHNLNAREEQDMEILNKKEKDRERMRFEESTRKYLIEMWNKTNMEMEMIKEMDMETLNTKKEVERELMSRRESDMEILNKKKEMERELMSGIEFVRERRRREFEKEQMTKFERELMSFKELMKQWDMEKLKIKKEMEKKQMTKFKLDTLNSTIAEHVRKLDVKMVRWDETKRTSRREDLISRWKNERTPVEYLRQMTEILSPKTRTEEHITDMNTFGSDTNMKRRLWYLTKPSGTEISTGKHMQDDNDLYSDTVTMNSLRLVLIGKTGAGKSKTGNTILNGEKHFPSSSQGSSLTDVCKLRDATVFGKPVSIVDTPGLLDTSKEEVDVLSEITRCIYMSAPGPHAIILVVPVGRFTAEDVYTVEKFVKHFGEKLFRYIIVTFSRFDDYKRDIEDNDITDFDIKKYVSTLSDKVQEFINVKCHARVIGIDNTLQGGESEKQVRQLLNLVDDIKRENGNTFYTNDDYEKAEKQVKEDIRKEEERLKNISEAEQARIQKEIDEAADEKAKIQIQEKMEAFEREMEIKMKDSNIRKDVQQNTGEGFDKFAQISSIITTLAKVGLEGIKVYAKYRKN